MGTRKRPNIAALIVDPPEVWIPANFPRLAAAGSYDRTSDKTSNYNCIAWAINRNDDWWWPEPDAYWPDPSATKPTVDAFGQVFEDLGYRRAKSLDRDWGYEKIALYVDSNGTPTHAARQLPNGEWTSKLGHGWDITHRTLDDLYQSIYGTALHVWRRRIVSFPLATLLAILQAAFRVVSFLGGGYQRKT